MAWLVYELRQDSQQNRYRLTRDKIVYTRFNAALNKITTAEAGNVQGFISQLQERLDTKLEGNSPDAPTLLDVFNDTE